MSIDISSAALVYVWQLNMQRTLYLNITKVGHSLRYLTRQWQPICYYFDAVFVKFSERWYLLSYKYNWKLYRDNICEYIRISININKCILYTHTVIYAAWEFNFTIFEILRISLINLMLLSGWYVWVITCVFTNIHSVTISSINPSMIWIVEYVYIVLSY